MKLRMCIIARLFVTLMGFFPVKKGAIGTLRRHEECATCATLLAAAMHHLVQQWPQQQRQIPWQ